MRYATLSDGTGVDNPRWGRTAADRLSAAQQRLARAKRRSNNRKCRRETVAARHRKIANQRKDFHHKQARALVAEYDLLVVEDLPIANMLRRAKPVADPETPGQFLPNGARAKSGLSRSISDAGWASSSRFCAPKRKMLGAPGLRSIPGTRRMAAKTAGMQPPKTASPKRHSNASDAFIVHRQTSMPHATSYGPGWPFTLKRREKKPAASSRRRSHPHQGASSSFVGAQRAVGDLPPAIEWAEQVFRARR
jgi:Probable transposase